MANQKTVGEQRVRVEFNPLNTDLVAQIKQKAAELINLVESIEDNGDEETQRVKYFATYEFENGAMWAVKAATA